MSPSRVIDSEQPLAVVLDSDDAGVALPNRRPPRPLDRVPQVDALRGVAALLVVLHHCGVYGNVVSVPAAQSWIFRPLAALAYGYVGVDLFLVLSGFCLAYPWLVDASRRFDFWMYLKRRVWRIYPPFLLTVLALLAVGWLVRRGSVADSPYRQLDLAGHLRSFELVGVLTLQMTRLNASFWSLCLEGRWYLAFPVVLWIARRQSASVLLAAAVVVTTLLPSGLTGPAKLAVYLPAFVAGVLAAEVVTRPDRWRVLQRKPTLILGLVGSTLSLAWFVPGPMDAGRVGWAEVLPSTAVFFFLLLLAVRTPIPPSVLRPLEAVGWISYSLYLVHEPLIHLIEASVSGFAWPFPTRVAFWLLVVAPAMVVAGAAAYFAIERPFIRRAARKRGRSTGIAVAPVVAAPALATEMAPQP